MRGLVALAIVGLTVGSPALSAPNAGVEAVVDSFHSALARGDTKAASALLSEDAMIFEEGGAERSKAEYAADHLPADAAFAQVVPISTIRRSVDASDGIAWVASEGRMAGTYKGRTIDRATTETMVLRETVEGWRIVHIHWSSAAAPDASRPAD